MMTPDLNEVFADAQARDLAARAALPPLLCSECGAVLVNGNPRAAYQFCPACRESAGQARQAQAEADRLARELAAADRLKREQAAAAERAAAELAAVRIDPAEYLKLAGAPVRFHRASIEAARKAGDLPPALIDGVERWAAEPADFLVLTGTPGSGKSYMAVAAIRAALLAGTVRPGQVRFITEADYLARVGLDYGTPQRTRNFDAVPLLVYDDLASAYMNDLRRAALGELLRERWNAGLATIITSNLSLKAIGDLDGRIASVLAAGRNVLAFPTVDLRRKGSLGSARL